MRNIKYFIELISCIKDENIIFTFIGDSNYKPLTEGNFKNIKYVPLISHDKLSEYYNHADILLNLGVTIPSAISGKIFEYMSYGKPVVSTYSIDNEACLPYLKKYPLTYLIDEREEDIGRAAENLTEFIRNHCHERVDTAFINDIFIQNKPENFIYSLFGET